jgi:RNA polymerase sigma-70 factor, ECF subfamily
MPPPDVTRLFQDFRDGDPAALDALIPLVYEELRRIAGAFMQKQRSGHTLQPTALINEALIKLFHDADLAVADRAHFLALMARVMRQVLIDHARAHVAAKRGGGHERIPWDTSLEVRDENATEQLNVLDLDRALEALGREEPSLAQVVEMHYFGGMTAEEASVVLGRSVHVVRHELRVARAWLRRELAG